MHDPSKAYQELCKENSLLKQRIQELEASELEFKQVKNKLSQTARQLADILESTNVGSWEWNVQTGEIFFNERWAEILGYELAELTPVSIDTCWCMLVHPDDLPMSNDLLEKHFKKETPCYECEIRVRHKNGNWVWILDRGKVVKWTDDEKPLLISGTYQDITDRKLAEEKLKESEKKYREMYDFLPIPVYEMDSEANIVSANRASCETFGGTEEDLKKGLKAWQIVSPVSIDTAIKNKQRLLNGEQITGAEYILRRLDGSDFPAILFSSQIYSDGKIAGLRGAIVDITKRKQQENELRESEERYRTIIEQMEDGYFEVDLTGNFTFVNDAESKILGYSGEELIGMNYRQYLDERSAKKTYQHFKKLYMTGESIKSLDVEVIKKNRERGFHEISVSLKRNTEGKPIGFRGISRDVTERRILEDRLKRAEKMEALGQLAGGVAHDLNNVLGALTGYSELLLMEIPEGRPTRNNVEKILESAKTGAAIINDLLTLTRRGVAASKVINLNNIVRDFLKTPVFDSIKDCYPHVTVRTECQNDLLNITGSHVHLEKTLMNLVSNAVEAISGKGEVIIRTENRHLDKPIQGYDEFKKGDYIVLTVSDTGMGIPAEHREKIFEPFYTKKSMGKSGTGLGLAIVWGTVKDHNGYIDLQSKVGEGTTFRLYFPVTREELTAQQYKASIEKYMANGESILVVDDIAGQREVASKMLTRLGYKVHAVSCGEEAVEYLKGNKADVLFLDMIMTPGIDGLETYRRVLEISPKQKAILVSGFSETDRVREAQHLGAGAYVKKPYVMEKIGLAIRNELNR